ncbi:hypothetical protein CEUSTIGMA_g12575.t1 [Chlamydomonas eustigma]|uniref:J domain-containing protein n=1 Tax=Chlamydomonas eustigma TaxID=1157962 RepID=A0A250XQ06_9CHLO|nr:hypothetical protein CEUSTIGMA_g12575.t1 [Chlamydomonas eustigma]|eukprot:GAX85157.1 hypothetical protein CEUSTIGMA_g12575.t1 [Chlamydomonas eustigma]
MQVPKSATCFRVDAQPLSHPGGAPSACGNLHTTSSPTLSETNKVPEHLPEGGMNASVSNMPGNLPLHTGGIVSPHPRDDLLTQLLQCLSSRQWETCLHLVKQAFAVIHQDPGIQPTISMRDLIQVAAIAHINLRSSSALLWDEAGQAAGYVEMFRLPLKSTDLEKGLKTDFASLLTTSTSDSAFKYFKTGSGISVDDVNRAYRRLASLVHPDKCSYPFAGEAFKLLNCALNKVKDAVSVDEKDAADERRSDSLSRRKKRMRTDDQTAGSSSSAATAAGDQPWSRAAGASRINGSGAGEVHHRSPDGDVAADDSSDYCDYVDDESCWWVQWDFEGYSSSRLSVLSGNHYRSSQPTSADEEEEAEKLKGLSVQELREEVMKRQAAVLQPTGGYDPILKSADSKSTGDDIFMRQRKLRVARSVLSLRLTAKDRGT